MLPPMKMHRYFLSTLVCTLILLGACTKLPTGPACQGRWIPKSPDRLQCAPVPRNTILLIGDGMGPEQVRAGGLFAHGAAGTLALERLAHRGSMTTCSATDAVTDSAASATAMATGLKVGNAVLSMDIPGSGAPVETITEQSAKSGKSIGLVTTTWITHATPAAFALHIQERHMGDALVDALLKGIQPRVLMGGAKYADAARAQAADYAVVKNRAELLAIDSSKAQKVWGQFGDDNMPYEKDGVGELPHLSEMARVALQILETDPDGFFLMIEGGRIDHAGHENDIERLGPEVAEFDRAVQVALEWAKGRGDTLILVTADHETGGLKLPRAYKGEWPPPARWQHEDHTSTPVALYAQGPNAQLVREGLDNTDVFRILGGCPIPQP